MTALSLPPGRCWRHLFSASLQSSPSPSPQWPNGRPRPLSPSSLSLPRPTCCCRCRRHWWRCFGLVFVVAPPLPLPVHARCRRLRRLVVVSGAASISWLSSDHTCLCYRRRFSCCQCCWQLRRRGGRCSDSLVVAATISVVGSSCVIAIAPSFPSLPWSARCGAGAVVFRPPSRLRCRLWHHFPARAPIL